MQKVKVKRKLPDWFKVKFPTGENFHDLKEKYTNNKWTIVYIGNKMSFTNAVWGGWKLENHDSINEKTHVATIELLDQLKISDFVKGIVNHVEIQEVKKNSPSMQDVFLNVVKNG